MLLPPTPEVIRDYVCIGVSM